MLRFEPGRKYRLSRRFHAGFFLTARFQLGNGATEIEDLGLAARLAKLGAQRAGAFQIDRQVVIQDYAITLGTLNRNKSGVDVERNSLGIPFEWITPATTTPGIKVQ